eukprot:gene35464-43726_t
MPLGSGCADRRQKCFETGGEPCLPPVCLLNRAGGEIGRRTRFRS